MTRHLELGHYCQAPRMIKCALFSLKESTPFGRTKLDLAVQPSTAAASNTVWPTSSTKIFTIWIASPTPASLALVGLFFSGVLLQKCWSIRHRFTFRTLGNVPDKCHAHLIDETKLCFREHHALLERKQDVIFPQDLSLAEKVVEHLTPDRLISCENQKCMGKGRTWVRQEKAAVLQLG